MKKVLLALLCAVILFNALAVVAYADAETPAEDPVVEEYVNFASYATSLAFSNGSAVVTVSYNGIPNVTTGATITTKLQKRFLLFFWQDVDIGMPNNEWVDQVSASSYSGQHSVAVGSGTYKAIVTYVISGTGGSPETVQDEIQKTN